MKMLTKAEMFFELMLLGQLSLYDMLFRPKEAWKAIYDNMQEAPKSPFTVEFLNWLQLKMRFVSFNDNPIGVAAWQRIRVEAELLGIPLISELQLEQLDVRILQAETLAEAINEMLPGTFEYDYVTRRRQHNSWAEFYSPSTVSAMLMQSMAIVGDTGGQPFEMDEGARAALARAAQAHVDGRPGDN
jgi:hypothetical protein